MQVEKVEDRILFRFSYDIRTGETFGSSEMYSIAVNTSMMGSSIQVADESFHSQKQTGQYILIFLVLILMIPCILLFQHINGMLMWTKEKI